MPTPFARLLAPASAAALCLASGAPAPAQDAAFGATLFRGNCAVCHGLEGAGDGPVAALLDSPPADLRRISAGNDGQFPFVRVYESIDGRMDVPAHGGTDMPIWGDLFNAEALPKTIHPGVRAEDLVQARVLGLVYFIQSIQQD